MRGGAVVPLTTQGRLAPAGLVPELALGALRAMESQLGRLVICQVGRKAFLHVRPPDQPALDAARNQSDLLGAHALILGRRRRCPTAAQRNEAPEQTVQPSSPLHSGASLTRSPCWACSCTPPGSGVAICGNFLTNQPYHGGEAPEAPIFPRKGIAGRTTDYRRPAPSPRTLLPDRNTTAHRRSAHLPQTCCTLPRLFQLFEGRRLCAPSSASRLPAHSHKERVRASADPARTRSMPIDPSCSRVGASEMGSYRFAVCLNNAQERRKGWLGFRFGLS